LEKLSKQQTNSRNFKVKKNTRFNQIMFLNVCEAENKIKIKEIGSIFSIYILKVK
jgi:hypothetical protein